MSRIYCETSKSNLKDALTGIGILQADIQCHSKHSNKYIVALYPEADSSQWYFLAPDRDLWLTGIGSAKTAHDCLALYKNENDAYEELTSILRGLPNAKRAAIFKTKLDNNGDLMLFMHKEYAI